MGVQRWLGWLSGAIAGALLAWPAGSWALPSYARQTGEACVACHVSFPELTPYGRLFKLSGYTLGTAKLFPLAGMAQASVSHIGNTQGNDSAYPRQNGGVIEGGSLFVAGKISDHAGMFSQWTFNALNQNDGSQAFSGHTSIDNNDWRLTDHIAKPDLDLIYGLSLNNNPTVQDAWNSTPAFGYPYQSSHLLGAWGIAPPSTLIEGGLAQQVAGVSAYGFLNKAWYFELGGYRAAKGATSFLRSGVGVGQRLAGTNPYWRFAYSHDWGEHSLEAGTFGLDARVNIDPADGGSPTDRYRDLGVDAQYQFLSDPHVFTTQVSFIHERADWDASHLGVDVQNPGSDLNSFRIKGSYWYQRTYGLTLAYFSESGSHDSVAYPTTGSPDTRGYIAEFDYMIKPNWRVGLQYAGFLKYLGAGSNYDGNGRNARDNNVTYLYTWVAF
ncbi:cytochrome C [Xenophilus sp. AP218F]|nr:cytochrome C [Xenophilus sp. AP218F]